MPNNPRTCRKAGRNSHRPTMSNSLWTCRKARWNSHWPIGPKYSDHWSATGILAFLVLII